MNEEQAKDKPPFRFGRYAPPDATPEELAHFAQQFGFSNNPAINWEVSPLFGVKAYSSHVQALCKDGNGATWGFVFRVNPEGNFALQMEELHHLIRASWSAYGQGHSQGYKKCTEFTLSKFRNLMEWPTS